jgi:xanthine permease XanP
VALIAILTQLDTLGSATILDKLDDADWKRANLQVVGGGVRANGLGDLCAGLFGSFPSCVSSANIALVYATRASARWVGLVTAALLALVAFMPQFTLALTLIPVPVLGAVALYAAGFLMVSGMEVLTSRAMDSRGIFAVGLSMSAGLAVMQLPQLTEKLPPSLHFLLGDGFVVSGLLVMALNLLFHIGTAQRAEQALHPESPELHAEITGFVERQGAAWGARRAVVQRAALAALEGAEAIASAGGRTLTGIRGSFDEFNLDLELLHSGAPLALQDNTHTPAHATLLDGDDSALDAALAQISGRLLRHLADRVNATENNGQSLLRLHFEH